MNNDNRFYIIMISMILLIFLIVTIKESGVMDDRLTYENDDFTLNNTKPWGKQEGPYGVTSDSTIATEVGMNVLEQGGNAVDAAIAVGFALGVVEPHGSGIGGGGTMLIHSGRGQEPVVYDYRETAPDKVPSSGSGVPGFVKGMYKVHEDFGTTNMEQLIQPSINLAKNGITVSETLHESLEVSADRLPDLNHYFPGGEPIEEGELLTQKQLAETLKEIQTEGPDAFYNGDIATEINDEEEELDKKNLKSYNVEVKQPLKGEFGGYDVLAPPPPSGGVMLIQTLEMAESLQIEDTKNNPLDFSATMGMISRRSYHDRLQKVGDPHYTDVPIKEMISQDHIKDLASSINSLNKSENFRTNLDSDADIEDHGNTTHFVVVDKNGMMVSVTNTLSDFFGSGEYVNGFFLNNQLKNFSNNKHSPNRPEPGKRPFSYTSPTILAKNGKPVIGIGSAGGRRITSMVAQQLVKMIKFNEPIQAAVEEPRTFLEFNQDVLKAEKDFVFLKDPENLGIDVEFYDNSYYFGNVQGLVIDYRNNKMHGISDPRRQGSWMSK
ncbi:gamma-glutamyltransferase [Alteribacillus bidgolensis]|uniref:Glutathione hydrolase proenzyme n=1 Tax=Alteribacillus bidgolensis TaxID=930129 RepID=A0A1G8PYZ4_9BACI|nr:gamma-glutamyltransferase [Alteribacillus bidgolensis]SDI97667.1 gamma-glutamyltranspeptidase / glutathione hydrolase [Alteribacillus bidgolensis]